MKLFILLLISLSVSSCQEYNLNHDKVEATIVIRDEVKYGNLDVCGYAAWSGSKCIIVIKREYYPQCLTHEIRHCFEGKYHR